MFHKVTYKGAPIVQGKRVTGITNGEEEAVHLTHVAPFLVEDELKRVGAHYEKVADLGKLCDRRWPYDYRAESRVVDGGGARAGELDREEGGITLL